MVKSAWPSRPTWASRGLGIKIPWEFPSRRMAICMRFIVITMGHHAAWTSIGFVVAKHLHDGEQNDLEVEHRRPVPQVIEIEVHARFHLLELGGLAAAAADLCKSGDARQYFVAHHVA